MPGALSAVTMTPRRRLTRKWLRPELPAPDALVELPGSQSAPEPQTPPGATAPGATDAPLQQPREPQTPSEITKAERVKDERGIDDASAALVPAHPSEQLVVTDDADDEDDHHDDDDDTPLVPDIVTWRDADMPFHHEVALTPQRLLSWLFVAY